MVIREIKEYQNALREDANRRWQWKRRLELKMANFGYDCITELLGVLEEMLEKCQDTHSSG